MIQKKKACVRELMRLATAAIEASGDEPHGFVEAFMVFETSKGNFAQYTSPGGMASMFEAAGLYAEAEDEDEDASREWAQWLARNGVVDYRLALWRLYALVKIRTQLHPSHPEGGEFTRGWSAAFQCMEGMIDGVIADMRGSEPLPLLQSAAVLVREFATGETEEEAATLIEQAAEHIEMFAEHEQKKRGDGTLAKEIVEFVVANSDDEGFDSLVDRVKEMLG